ncbi:helix-turn-helix domain-containing protein [Clostridium sp. CF012]|uniref:helix-turn-helix domain-containing protein n=1 Tax=Clostridium sp. CF012 TaxID=2843319 RepID=UPI001C0DC763|nr:helix-turn-helix domain-containing protein [Clostridium sp. CF012]MBU3146249.1 hypothetical protein [Clostridium sp. CF012]
MVTSLDEKFELGTYMANIERAIIEKTLRKNAYNISKTSRELSISRQDLQYKIKKHNLDLR